MSVNKEYDYPLAPLTVTTGRRRDRTLDFEVNRDGSIMIVAMDGTTETSFWLTPEDWAAVVAHVAADQAKVSRGVT